MFHVGPQSFQHARAQLAKVGPLDAVFICSGYAQYLSSSIAPTGIQGGLVLECNERDLQTLEQETFALIALAEDSASESIDPAADEAKQLLGLMVRHMLRHSKIGQFNHCPKETVLKCIRASRMNVPLAEKILDRNSDAYYDTGQNDCLLLWKEHHDGRQYFLNPQKVTLARAMVSNS